MKRSLRLVLVLFMLLSAAWSFAQKPDSAANPWEKDIQKFEKSDSLHPPPRGAILFVGSSSIRLWRRLQQDFPRSRVINRGFGGCELSDVVHFADRIILPYSPRIVIVYAGDNDVADGKTPEQILAAYERLVRLIHDRLPQTRIGFISIKPSLARWNLVDTIRTANTLVKDFSQTDRRLMYINTFSAMLGKDGTPRKELFAPDGLHLNRAGYTLWAKIVRPYLNTVQK